MDELFARLFVSTSLSETFSRGALLAARLGPLTVLAPWLALRAAPGPLQAALMLALTIALFPIAAAAPYTPPPNALAYVAATLRETLIGLAFALAAALPLHALEWAGRLVDTWRGAGFADVIAPFTGERTSPLGQLTMFAGVVLFLSLGGHRVALEAFAEGLRLAPIGAPLAAPSMQAFAIETLRLASAALALSVAIAGPAAVTLLALEVGFGLIGRAAPQMPVFFAAMPLRAAAGLAAFWLGLAIALAELPHAFEAAIRAARALFGLP